MLIQALQRMIFLFRPIEVKSAREGLRFKTFQVFEVLNGIATYSLTWVGDRGDLLLKILDKDIDLTIIDENLAGMAGS
jgi:hypothetical protein